MYYELLLVRVTVIVGFHADAEDDAEADRWARRMGVERSELLREPIAMDLARLAAEENAAAFEAQTFNAEELALDNADERGPA